MTSPHGWPLASPVQGVDLALVDAHLVAEHHQLDVLHAAHLGMRSTPGREQAEGEVAEREGHVDGLSRSREAPAHRTDRSSGAAQHNEVEGPPPGGVARGSRGPWRWCPSSPTRGVRRSDGPDGSGRRAPQRAASRAPSWLVKAVAGSFWTLQVASAMGFPFASATGGTIQPWRRRRCTCRRT